MKLLSDPDLLKPVLVERNRIDSKKRGKFVGPLSEIDYASASRQSRGDNGTITEDGFSLGATSPARIGV